MPRLKQIDLQAPVFVNRKPANIIHNFRSNGNIVVVVQGERFARSFTPFGKPADDRCYDLTNAAPITVEVVTLYPSGDIYVKGTPVRTSSFGVENLIQVEVTRQGDQIIKKRLL